MYRDLREPELHTNITDELPDDHPLAWTSVYCVQCRAMLHASNNENMDSWFETNSGAYCCPCWHTAYDDINADYQQLGLYDLTFENAVKGHTPEQAWDVFNAEALRIGITGDEMLWRHRHNEWPPNLSGLNYHLTVLLPLLGDRQPAGSYPTYH